MRNGIDPQPRRIALADAAIEQIDIRGNFREQRDPARFVEDFEAGDFGIAQVDHDADTVRSLDPGLAQGVAQPERFQPSRMTFRVLLGHRFAASVSVYLTHQ